MVGDSEWGRQKREILSYNVFYSALTPRAEPCLAKFGFELPVAFPTIDDERNGIRAEPDFVLYDGETLLLVEVKSGDNIDEDHVSQMEACNNISIEAAEEFLKDADVKRRTSYTGDVNTVETAISYQGIHEAYIQNCRHAWPDCKEKLEDLEQHAAILAQGEGSPLRLVAGEFKSENFNDVFGSGVSLPKNSKTEFVLTENTEVESVAVAICQIFGFRAAKGPVEVTPSDIRSYFAPRHAVRFSRIRRAAAFLNDIGACDVEAPDEVEDGEYEESKLIFTVDHMEEILDIERTVSETSVSDHFKEGGQTALTEFEGQDQTDES